jgi:GTP diphosphokinase / guanosine-3',5'-bis(diphosphate) 3'-diphosphatase
MIRLADIIAKVESYHAGADLDLIKKAYVFANKAHDGQVRRSGDPYVMHPLEVASIIADLRLDVPSVCAGLLHDCVEDTSATVEELGQLFGPEVAFLVDGVTKLGKISWTTREERQAENFRKMLLAMARDIRVILVKLADRAHNMRTLEHMPPEKQERIARETMDIYAPLANRLGIMWIKCELEDNAFKYLEPVEYEHLRSKLDRTEKERAKYIEEVETLIHAEMTEGGVECEVTGRAKHLWSIYQKMKKTERELEQIYDAIGFRVVTESIRECYQALGVAHSKWTPIPGRFKDYIALPKPNMYQSLHTSVIGPHGWRMEIQIRTREMHKIAEEGIAAHWKYKEGKPAAAGKDDQKFAWLRQLMEFHQDLKDPTEFIETVKVDLFGDEVYVFTPQGDVKALPKGSCVIDFAYAVHTQVGNRCAGGKVNGSIVPLRYQLRNGDTCEIITSPNQRPNKDWLKFVFTSGAKSKIRHILRGEQRERAKTLGKELLERELRRWDLGLSKVTKNGDLEKAASHHKAGSIEDLIALVGYGKVTPAQVIEVIVPEERRKQGPQGDTPSSNPITNFIRKVTRRTPSTGGIKVAGEDDVLVRYAKCCNPLPGDAIVGFITRGRGVTVHTRECQKALDLDPDRRIEVEWDGKSKPLRPVSVQVVTGDKPGILAAISQAFSEGGINIQGAECRVVEENRAVNTFEFSVTDLDQLKKVIRTLQGIEGVYSVERVSNPGG